MGFFNLYFAVMFCPMLTDTARFDRFYEITIFEFDSEFSIFAWHFEPVWFLTEAVFI